MPKMATIQVNPAFKAATDEEKALLASHAKGWTLKVPYITATENIRMSRGMYRMAVVEKVAEEAADDAENA